MPRPWALIERAAEGLAGIVTDIRARAPHARVVLVDYLPLFDADMPTESFGAADVARIRQIAALLSSAYHLAAQRTGAELVPSSALAGHGVGSSSPWVNGAGKGAASYHPAEGMQGVANLLLGLRSISGT